MLSRVQLLVTPRTAAHQTSLSITNSCTLLKLMSIESVMPSTHLILFRPLHLMLSIFPSLRVFFSDPADVGNLISGSSAFSKTSLNIRKFTVHILLKPGMENFGHYFIYIKIYLCIYTKGTLHAKMDSIKDKNDMDLTEAEDIKKRVMKEESVCGYRTKGRILGLETFCILRV